MSQSKPEFTIEDDVSELRWLRAPALWGLAAAVSGGLLLYLLIGTSGYYFLTWRLALAVGIWIGLAVRFGSRRHGGLACQGMAMLLTYAALTLSFVPAFAGAIASQSDSPMVVAWLVAFPTALIAPFMTGAGPLFGVIAGLAGAFAANFDP